MTEFFIFLICIFIVALVGHGIWLFGAFLLRLVLGETTGDRLAVSDRQALSPSDDLLKADECIERLTRGKILDYDAYLVVRDKLEQAAERANLRLLDRLPARKSAALPTPAAVFDNLTSPAGQGVLHVPLGQRDGLPTRASELPPAIVANMLQQSVSVHALDQDYSEPPAAPKVSLVKHSRKAAGEMVQEFLNEKNIHWGELLAGVLIVGCAVGLILSLRSQLSQIIPMFSALLFLLVTAAIHFAGFYTLSHWKLPSTSRGLLLIGSLLVPITCLAASLLADHGGHASIFEPGFIALMILGGGACSTLVYYGGRHLLPSQPATWTVGIMGSSLAQGFINRAAADSLDTVRLSVLGCLTLIGLAYVVARNVLLPRATASFKPAFSMTDWASITPQLKLYGTTFFSLIVAAGLLVFRVDDHIVSLLPLAIPLAGLGLLTSTIGCGLGRRNGSTAAVDASRPAASLDWEQAWNVLSTAIMILGGVLIVAAAFFAKDDVQFVIGIAIISGFASGALAYLFRQPALTAVSVFGLSTGVLLLWHLFSGTLPHGPLKIVALEQVATHGLTGVVLLVLAMAWGLGGWWFRLQSATFDVGKREQSISPWLTQPLQLTHTQVMQTAAGILALMAVVVSGYGAYTAMSMSSMCSALAVLACAATAGLVIGRIRHDGLLMILGSGLVFVICATLLRSSNPVAALLGVTAWEMPWKILLALLSHASIVTLARLLMYVPLAKRDASTKDVPLAERHLDSTLQTLGLTAAATAAASIPLLVRWDELVHLGTQAACLALAGIICVMQGRLERGSAWRIVGQASLGMAAAQVLALLLSSVTSSWLAPEQCLILAVSLITFCVSVVASLPVVARSSWSALAPWKRIDADVVCVAFLLYLFALTIRFWNTPGAIFTPDAWLFALSITLVLVGSLLLAALRHRQFYQFVAGTVACFATAVYCEWLVPQTLLSSTILVLMCMSSLAIVLGFAVYDVWIDKKRIAADQPKLLAGGTPMEELVSWGTLLAWFCLTCVSYAAELTSTSSNASSIIASPLGLTWILLGLATFAIQSPIRAPLIACNRVYGASLLLLLQSPLWLNANLSSSLSGPMLLALILSAVAVHAAMAGLVVRICSAQHSRQTWMYTLFEQFFSAGYRAQAASLIANLVELSAGAILVVSVPFALAVTDPNSLRVLALAVFMSSVGLIAASSAPTDDARRLPRMRFLAIGVLCWFAILLAWSSLPELDAMQLATLRFLRASCVLYIAAVFLVVAYSRHFVRAPLWIDAVRKSWPAALGLAVAAGLCATGLAWQQMEHQTGLPEASFDAVCLALAQIATVVVLVVQTLYGTWNIAQFADRQRSTYVYFAEAIAGITAIGLYVVFPQWFNLPFKQYWPLIVLGVALVSSAIAKLLSAKKLDVLGEPIARTSLLLPIVAAIGVFIVGSSASSDLVLALGATYYFVLAAADGSRRLAVVGMTLVNVALLLFWHRYPELDFGRHPQLWMLPPALSVLVASHFHRRELSAQAITWIRYAALGTIFLSSTSEILLIGIGQSLWPPMVLTVLSVLAVFLGIGLRTRSFVYFGFVFLLVSTTAMVAHAQQSLGHTWPWWALGITLGIGILVLFGLFEKKRNEMQQLTDKLRTWEA